MNDQETVKTYFVSKRRKGLFGIGKRYPQYKFIIIKQAKVVIKYNLTVAK